MLLSLPNIIGWKGCWSRGLSDAFWTIPFVKKQGIMIAEPYLSILTSPVELDYLGVPFFSLLDGPVSRFFHFPFD